MSWRRCQNVHCDSDKDEARTPGRCGEIVLKGEYNDRAVSGIPVKERVRDSVGSQTKRQWVAGTETLPVGELEDVSEHEGNGQLAANNIYCPTVGGHRS